MPGEISANNFYSKLVNKDFNYSQNWKK